jgi:hypothetical protein
MNTKQRLAKHIRGWLPKKPSNAYQHQTPKPKPKPYLKAFAAVAVVVLLAGASFFAARTYLRYSNPASDVTTCYFQKTTNSTKLNVGDTVEVQVMVYWHGYVVPEFGREVKIVDPIPEAFVLVDGSNSLQEQKGFGGSYLLTYTLKAENAKATFTDLPAPQLKLDNTEIVLQGSTPTLTVKQ